MKTLFQFAKFLAAGGTGLLVVLGVTYLLNSDFHLWYFWAYCIATLAGWTAIFFINSLITFAGHNKEKYAKSYATFIGMYLIAFGINASIVYSLTSVLKIHYIISIVLATVVTTFITFTTSKRVIFKFEDQTNV